MDACSSSGRDLRTSESIAWGTLKLLYCLGCMLGPAQDVFVSATEPWTSSKPLNQDYRRFKVMFGNENCTLKSRQRHF